MKRVLSLNVETVRTLTDSEASTIVGGQVQQPTDSTPCNNTFSCAPCDGSVYVPPPPPPPPPGGGGTHDSFPNSC